MQRLLAIIVLCLWVLPARAEPHKEWRTADPATAGWSAAALQPLRDYADLRKPTALLLVQNGAVIASFGDPARKVGVASVRKSLLSALYGIAVAEGRIDLDSTLGELRIDEKPPGLSEQEKDATVGNLLTARSGIYLPAAHETSEIREKRPARGSHEPGTFWFYNNWDFNALGTIFEKATGKDIYAAFEQDFARLMQFQDFRLEAQRKARRPQASQHPAYHFYLSTRDMARLGLLMLRHGRWGNTRLLSEEWVEEMVAVETRVADMNPASYREGPFGYGYLWWIWDGPFNTGIYRNAYTGIGAIGQFITVLPELDMVVAHKTRQNATAVTRPQYLGVLDRLGAARCAR
jgi:CubicO group peptidase (beta-lactamase class C family)